MFTVSRSGDTTGTSSVVYQTTDGSATTSDSDYVAIPASTLNFLANQTRKNITVNVNGDLTVEPDETFFVTLSNPTDATIADPTGQGTILDDDTTPTISFLDFSDPSGLSLVGRAETVLDDMSRPVLRLTPAEQGTPGGAWFEEQQFVSVGFETSFGFRMNDGSDGGDGTDGSDGFAFADSEQ